MSLDLQLGEKTVRRSFLQRTSIYTLSRLIPKIDLFLTMLQGLIKVQLCFQQKDKVSDCIVGAWCLLTAFFHFPHVVLPWNYSRKWDSETADTWFDYSVTSGSMATIPWTGRIKLWELTTKNENETVEQFKKTKVLVVEVFRTGVRVFSQKIVLAPFHCLL